MDLAKNLAQWRDRSPEQWIALANRWLPPVVVAVLVLLIAFNAADLTWRLLDSPETPAIALPAAAAATTTTRDAGAYQALADWEPFGKAPDESSEAIAANLLLDAPETTLALTLIGVVSAQELPERGSLVLPERGAAIIAVGGRGGQKVFWSGDPIEGIGNNITLHSVFDDGNGELRAVINRGGRFETVFRHPDADSTAARPASRVASRSPLRRSTPVPASAAISVADAVNEAAAVVSQHIQFAMATENGQLIGFRVNPHNNSQVFSELGLEAGDVLTEVNGVRLNGMQNVAPVLQALSETDQANVRLRRGDNDMALVLNVGQIEQLAKSLQ